MSAMLASSVETTDGLAVGPLRQSWNRCRRGLTLANRAPRTARRTRGITRLAGAAQLFEVTGHRLVVGQAEEYSHGGGIEVQALAGHLADLHLAHAGLHFGDQLGQLARWPCVAFLGGRLALGR